jgi:hypothetical protein
MRSLLLVLVLTPLVCCTHSFAALTAFWQPVAISAAAIAHDPALANMQSWNLMVTTDGNWASAGVRLDLPAGNTFYKNALGAMTKPNPAFFPIAPSLEFTTYVTAPADTGAGGAPAILGYFPEEFGPGSLGDSASTRPGQFSVSWGDLVTDPPGVYQILRITFPQGVLPEIHPLSQTSEVNPDNTFLIGGRIPEPSTLTLLAGLAVLRLTRMRLR